MSKPEKIFDMYHYPGWHTSASKPPDRATVIRRGGLWVWEVYEKDGRLFKRGTNVALDDAQDAAIHTLNELLRRDGDNVVTSNPQAWRGADF